MDGRKATLQQQPRQPACCLFLLTPSHLQRAEPLAGVEVPESSPAVHCYRDDFRIKMGSDESHFNVALNARVKVKGRAETGNQAKHTHTHTHTHTRTHACTHSRTHGRTRARTHAHMHSHTHARTRAHTHKYTHTNHTHRPTMVYLEITSE